MSNTARMLKNSNGLNQEADFAASIEYLKKINKTIQKTPENMKNSKMKGAALSSVLKKHKTQVEVLITKDKGLLKQYYDLRHKVYREENQLENYNGAESKNDRDGFLFIAIEDHVVLGGARLMCSDKSEYMSNEHPGTKYVYETIMEKYDKRDHLTYCEISSVVVKNDKRNGEITKEIFKKVASYIKEAGYNYVFWVAFVAACRGYRRNCKELGYDVEICMNMPWKELGPNKALHRTFPMYLRVS